MNPAFATVIEASDDDRRGLFLAAAAALGTTLQNVEKDFWVCWTLDILFNGLPAGQPRLLFKGGTSLSKGFGLISRFSEDIDVTVFRQDLGENASIDELEAMSRRKREQRLDAIKAKASDHINGPMREAFATVLQKTSANKERFRIEADADDPGGQTLLFWYPSVANDLDHYVRSAVKIEAGAKSALDPHTPLTITPYVDAQVPELDLVVPNVTTVQPERTFWDKVVILHGIRHWYERRGKLYQGGQRISRHYYDIYKLVEAEVGNRAIADPALGEDCVRHARLFFNRPDFDLAHAAPGSFALAPLEGMRQALESDYGAMAGMIFGDVPSFQAVQARISGLEDLLNARG